MAMQYVPLTAQFSTADPGRPELEYRRGVLSVLRTIRTWAWPLIAFVFASGCHGTTPRQDAISQGTAAAQVVPPAAVLPPPQHWIFDIPVLAGGSFMTEEPFGPPTLSRKDLESFLGMRMPDPSAVDPRKSLVELIEEQTHKKVVFLRAAGSGSRTPLERMTAAAYRSYVSPDRAKRLDMVLRAMIGAANETGFNAPDEPLHEYVMIVLVTKEDILFVTMPNGLLWGPGGAFGGTIVAPTRATAPASNEAGK